MEEKEFSVWEWREVGGSLLYQIGLFMECKDQEQGNHLLEEEVWGGFGKEVIGDWWGKCRILTELDELRNKLETIRGLEDEVGQLQERLERERKRNNVLADTN